jgi:hypothetical protein
MNMFPFLLDLLLNVSNLCLLLLLFMSLVTLFSPPIYLLSLHLELSSIFSHLPLHLFIFSFSYPSFFSYLSLLNFVGTRSYSSASSYYSFFLCISLFSFNLFLYTFLVFLLFPPLLPLLQLRHIREWVFSA